MEANLVALCASQEISKSLEAVSKEVGIYSNILQDNEVLLNKIYEMKPALIVLHTDLGLDKLGEVLKDISNDEVARLIPIVVISDIEDSESLSEDLKDSKVISILTYKNWSYQLSQLLKYLSSSHLDISDNENIDEESLIDPLTDVLTWAGAGSVFKALVSDFNDTDRPFSLIMFGLDGIDNMMEEYGADVVDEVFVSIANIAQQNIRRYDTVLRFNQDKFAIFLSGAPLEIAKTKAESFRYEMEMKGHGFDKIKATVSLCVLEYSQGTSLDELSIMGESLVSKARQEGGNTVV